MPLPLTQLPKLTQFRGSRGSPLPYWRELQAVLQEKLYSRSKSLRALAQPASRKSTTSVLTVCALEQTTEPSALNLLGPHVPSKCVSDAHSSFSSRHDGPRAPACSPAPHLRPVSQPFAHLLHQALHYVQWTREMKGEIVFSQ